MFDNRENFLDSKTFISVVFLILCWLGWNHYMKKKYPLKLKEEISKVSVEEKEGQSVKSYFLEKEYEKEYRKGYREKTLNFKGENMDIVFSSKGLGVKQLKLKKYNNRQKKPIVFDYLERPLFSSFFFESTEDFIPFEIKRQGNLFIGVFSSSSETIKKIIEVDDKKYILKNTITIQSVEGYKPNGLSLLFSYLLPKEKETASFLRMFLIYGQDILKGFVFYDGKRKEWFTAEDFQKGLSYLNLQMAALGGKYFGKAFINDSSFFPSVTFERDKGQILARVDYKFLHSKAQELKYRTFLGPKSLKNFQVLGGEAKEWLDFGFFGWLARPLLLFLNGLYNLCGNWGWSIVILTLFVRLCLLPINVKSYKSMKIMQKLQPKIKELREKYKSDPKKMNREYMSLMKQNKVNPLGACLPMFLQLPIFFALYRVLGESIELYQSPFIFWIKDLSLKDPYYLLPILGGLVLFVQQRLTPINLPKEQARLFAVLPLLFSLFFLGLPSGLTLYIFVSGFFGLVQQFFFVRMSQAY